MRPKPIKANEFDTDAEKLVIVNELLGEIRYLSERVVAVEDLIEQAKTAKKTKKESEAKK